MTKEDIIRLSGQVIEKDVLEQIMGSEDVKVVRDNGIDGSHPGKRWYVVVFNSGRGISVYCRNKDMY